MSTVTLLKSEKIVELLDKNTNETITSLEIVELRELLRADCLEITEFEMAKLAFWIQYTNVFHNEADSDGLLGNWIIDSVIISEFYSNTKGIHRIMTGDGDFYYFTKDALQEYEEQLTMANAYTVDDLILRDKLNEFLGSRELNSQLEKHLLSLREPLSCVLHRGMSFPVHLLKIGGVLDEWHGSSHWSKDFEVALGFATDGYVNSDYLDDLIEEIEHDKDLLSKYNAESASDLFKEVVFRLTTNTEAIDVHKLALELNLTEWLNEQEVTFIGTDFIITELQYIDIVGETPYYLVDVEEIPTTFKGDISQ